MKFSAPFRYFGKKVRSVLRWTFPTLKPSAICIGAQKSGTTALYHYLAGHPGAAPSGVKEIDFFNCNSRYARGLRYYHSHFPLLTPASKGKRAFDITPGYLGGAERAAKRIHEYNPDMRFIVLLRNPITRAYSAWEMYRKLCSQDSDWFWEWARRCDKTLSPSAFVKRSSSFGQSFSRDALEEIEAIQSGRVVEMPILSLGVYHRYLKHYFDLFPQNQFLIISSEEFRQDTKGHLRLIEAFTGLEPHSWTQAELKPRHVGAYTDGITQNDYTLLKSFYQEHNFTLFALLQREFSWD